MTKVFVTGMGVISAIGNNLAENLDSLKKAKSGIRPIEILDSIHRGKWSAAEIPYSTSSLIEMVASSDNKPFTRGILFSLIAAKEAIEDAGITTSELEYMPIIGANTVGGMDMTEQYYNNFESANPYFLNEAHSGAETTKRLADYFGSKSMITTINTACSSSANAIILGTRLIKSGRAKRVLVGGSDSLSKFSLNGFASLMIYDKEPCKPFDKDRDGLNLGEAGAFLVLESQEEAKNKNIYAEVVGYANRNDAFHYSASSPNGEGAFQSMQAAIKMAKIEPEDISFVHAHGTATPNNDETEGIAIQRVFNKSIPPFASSKSFVGHTLGAAGAINSIFSILALKHSFIFPNLNFKTQIPGGIKPNTESVELPLKYCLSNSLGFGGNNATLVFKKLMKGGNNA